MNIAFLMQDRRQMYGAERAVADLLSGLKMEGLSCPLLLIEETRLGVGQSRFQEELAQRGLDFECIRTCHAFSGRLIRKVRKRVLDLNADVLHTIGYKADMHGGWAMKWGHVRPLVATVHGWLFRPDIKERFYKWLDVQCLKHFDKVIVLSRAYEDLLRREGIVCSRIVHISSGLNSSFLPLKNESEQKPAGNKPVTIGMLGRLSWEKNHEMFLRTAALIHGVNSNVRFLIAGDGPEKSALDTGVRKRQLECSLDYTPTMEQYEFFKIVDILAVCSRMENLPYNVLEAMWWGRPVVATRAGGLPELVDDGRTGFLVDVDDADGMTDRLLQLVDNQDLRIRMGVEGRCRVEQNHSMTNMVRAHIALYKQLVGKLPNGSERA